MEEEDIKLLLDAGFTEEEIQNINPPTEPEDGTGVDANTDPLAIEDSEEDTFRTDLLEAGFTEEEIDNIDVDPIESEVPNLYNVRNVQDAGVRGIQEKQAKRDADGETYVTPEWLHWAEDTWIGDAVTDMWRAGAEQGLAQRALADATARLDEGDTEDVREWQKAVLRNQDAEVSKEMKEFMEARQKEPGLWGTIKAIAKNPSVLSQIMATSFVGMTSWTGLQAGVVGAGAGAGAGSFAPGVGTALGAAGGFFGTLSGYTDGMLTFSELLQEELGDRWTDENAVLELLSDRDKVVDFRIKASKRGIPIGIIDGLTIGVAGGFSKTAGGLITQGSRTGRAANLFQEGVGTRLGRLSRSGALGSVAKKLPKTTQGVGIGLTEAIGGSTGELAAQVTSGQEIDAGEILLEGVAEFGGPGTVFSTVKAISEGVNNRYEQFENEDQDINSKSYHIGHERYTKEEFDKYVDSLSTEEAAAFFRSNKK